MRPPSSISSAPVERPADDDRLLIGCSLLHSAQVTRPTDVAWCSMTSDEWRARLAALTFQELAASRSREEELRGQMATTSADAPSGQRVASLEEKVQLQQDQLKQLRAARDSILAAQQDFVFCTVW
eukprot:s485_g7.t1